MRWLLEGDIDRYRDRSPIPAADRREHGGRGGVFWLPRPDGSKLLCVASTGGGWDHVSCSVQHGDHGDAGSSMPTYEDLKRVHRTFFKASEAAVEYFVPPSHHVDVHPHVRHLWRPTRKRLPRPPRSYV